MPPLKMETQFLNNLFANKKYIHKPFCKFGRFKKYSFQYNSAFNWREGKNKNELPRLKRNEQFSFQQERQISAKAKNKKKIHL